MWWDPTPADFVQSTGTLASGLGRLSKERYDAFKAMHRTLQSRAEAYKEILGDLRRFPTELEETLQNSCARLSVLQTTYEQMRFGVTDFQRLYLELRGYMDYVEIYLPRMNGRAPGPFDVADCVGVFTTTPNVVQEYFRGGIPVWFIRTAEHFRTAQCNIAELVTATQPAQLINTRLHPDPQPQIWNDVTSDQRKHTAVFRYARTWLSFKDPFVDPDESSSPSNSNNSKGGQPSTSHKTRVPKKNPST